jgi:hypothetical protein
VVKISTILDLTALDKLIGGIIENKELGGLSGLKNSSDKSYYNIVTTINKDYPF